MIVLCACLLSAGCGEEARKPDGKAPGNGVKAVEPLVFWHTQSQNNLDLLQKIVDKYNKTNPPIPVELQYAGNYTTLFQKVRASVRTGKLPDLVVAYESMVAEYIRLDAAVPLDEYINDEKIGLSKDSLADIIPSILDNCRYPDHDNTFYTFPFTKSILMMYYNADLLKKAGYDAPPKTWKEFKEQCLAVKKLGKKGYAVSVDASTLDAWVMSFGGQILNADRTKALFDAPAGIKAFTLLTDLVKSGAGYQIDRESYGDRKDFSAGECAFVIRSSTTRPYIAKDIKDKFKWDMAIIPHAEGVKPATVLFGANVAVMKTTPQRQRAAWHFVRYFSSKDVTAQWATGTGYLPVRMSAAETKAVQDFFAASPRSRRAFDALPHARPEPGVGGWQAVRTFIELAQSRAIGGRRPPEEIAKELAERANKALEKARR
jgi:ABC-type glycerol-3-phosphate transport system substrate-binding protein